MGWGWEGGRGGGVLPLSDTVQGVAVCEGEVHVHDIGGPATQWVCCKSRDAGWGPSPGASQIRLAVDIA